MGNETLPLVNEQANTEVLSTTAVETENKNFLQRWGDYLKDAAKKLQREILALYLAWGDSRTPWYAKALAALVLGYVLSPIDLIPDFIPVLGLIDDIILIPAGLWLLCKIIPEDVMADAKDRARIMEARGERAPINWCGALVVIAMWVVGLYWAFLLLRKIFVHPSQY